MGWEVTKCVLLGTKQEDAQVVVLVLLEGVHIQAHQALAVLCIAFNLYIRVAGDIRQL
jgi:hypothetical protein